MPRTGTGGGAQYRAKIDGLGGSNPPRASSQSGLYASLSAAMENCRLSAALCQ